MEWGSNCVRYGASQWYSVKLAGNSGLTLKIRVAERSMPRLGAESPNTELAKVNLDSEAKRRIAEDVVIGGCVTVVPLLCYPSIRRTSDDAIDKAGICQSPSGTKAVLNGHY